MQPNGWAWRRPGADHIEADLAHAQTFVLEPAAHEQRDFQRNEPEFWAQRARALPTLHARACQPGMNYCLCSLSLSGGETLNVTADNDKCAPVRRPNPNRVAIRSISPLLSRTLPVQSGLCLAAHVKDVSTFIVPTGGPDGLGVGRANQTTLKQPHLFRCDCSRCSKCAVVCTFASVCHPTQTNSTKLAP